MSKEQNKSGHLIDEATKTPRTQAAIKTYGDYIRSEDAVSIEFAEQLETELAEARAEIERLKCELIRQIQPEEYALSTYSTTAEPIKNAKDSLIEQTREALVAAKNDGKMQSAITYQLISAALSAAERMK